MELVTLPRPELMCVIFFLICSSALFQTMDVISHERWLTVTVRPAPESITHAPPFCL